MFIANGTGDKLEAVTLEQSESDVHVRVDGLVALSCLAVGRVLQFNAKWLKEKGYTIRVEE